MKSNENQGFTLLELLIVIAIIGVLAAFLMPTIGSARERAHTASCVSNMRQMVIAALIYADDHDELIPDIIELSNYIDDEKAFICSSDTRTGLGAAKPSYTGWKYGPTSLLATYTSEYVLYIESDKAGESGWDRTNITTSYIAFRHRDRTVIAFMDGHIAVYTLDQLGTTVTAPPAGPRE